MTPEAEAPPVAFPVVPRPLPPPSPHPDDAEIHTVTRFGNGTKTSATNVGRRGSRSKWSRKKKAGVGIGTVVALIVLGIGGAYLYAQWRFGQIKKISVAGLVPRQGNAPFNILLVGSDSRAFVDNSAEASQFGSASAASGQRSDVIIIARVAPSLHEIKLLSIPRDTYVDIPGNSVISGPNRINAAFNSGPSLLIQTIKRSFNIPISDYAEVGFPGFAGMVNALGGIGLNFPDPVRDAYSQLHITKTGCQLVNGTQALALVRSRHLFYESGGSWYEDGNSDFSRIQRQDAFFQAVIPKLRGVATSPTGLNSLLSAMTSDVTIDKSLTEGTLLGLSRDFHSSNGSPLTSETLPTISTQINGADVLIPAASADEGVISAFLAFGGPTTTTNAIVTPSGHPVDAVLTAAVTPGITVTTIPSNADPNAVNFNTGAEPWNPKPCSP